VFEGSLHYGKTNYIRISQNRFSILINSIDNIRAFGNLAVTIHINDNIVFSYTRRVKKEAAVENYSIVAKL